MTYIPISPKERDAMLETIGVKSLDALFDAIPAKHRFPKLDLPPALTEMEAYQQLSDIVFVEILVDEGDTIEAGKPIASVESVKASAEIYAPAGGKVAAVNKDLANKPETLNSDPYGEAWMIQLEGGSAGDVMDSAAYEKYCEERSH